MDKLRAYEILGVQPESSTDDVREAYAVLSKQFHPEEHPEEFRQIHEAYTTLVRGNRRRRGTSAEETKEMEPGGHLQIQTDPAENTRTKEESGTEQKRRFQKALHNAETIEKEETITPAYDFEGALDKAERDEAQRLHQKAVQALNEIRILTQPKYKEKLKLFQSFFGKEEYADVLKKTEFIGGLAEILADSKLKKGIYDYIIDFYRLRGCEERRLVPEKAALYRVLEQKRGMNAKKKEYFAYAVPAGVVAGMRAGFRDPVRDSEIMAVIVICVTAAILLIWLYHILYKNHSTIFSQFVIAAVIAVSQFGAIMFDFYGTAFGTVENGNVFAAFLMLAGLTWIAVLGIVFLILKIKNFK